MEVQAHIIEVVFDRGWKIVFRGERFGPCADLRDAVSTANLWAATARDEGHLVVVRVDAPRAVAVAMTGDADPAPESEP